MTSHADVLICPACGTGRALAMPTCPTCGQAQASEPAGKSKREKEIEAGLIQWLENAGYAVWKTSQYAKPKGMTPGLSDLIAFGYGTTLFLEVKTRSGRQSADQKRFEQAVVHKGGGRYLVVRTVAELQAYARDLIAGST